MKEDGVGLFTRRGDVEKIDVRVVGNAKELLRVTQVQQDVHDVEKHQDGDLVLAGSLAPNKNSQVPAGVEHLLRLLTEQVLRRPDLAIRERREAHVIRRGAELVEGQDVLREPHALGGFLNDGLTVLVAADLAGRIPDSVAELGVKVLVGAFALVFFLRLPGWHPYLPRQGRQDPSSAAPAQPRPGPSPPSGRRYRPAHPEAQSSQGAA